MLAAEVAAETFFGGLDILNTVADGAGGFAEVDMVSDDESGDHFGQEASSSGVGEGCCQSSGEGVQSLPGASGESSRSHRGASFRWGRCNFRREEAFLVLLSSLRHRGNSRIIVS